MFIKLAGISAALAGLFVVAFEVPSAQGSTPVEIRTAGPAAKPPAPPAVRHAVASPEVTPVAAPAGPNCRAQTWPYVDPSCISSERRVVRTIGMDRPDGRGGSPSAPTAQK